MKKIEYKKNGYAVVRNVPISKPMVSSNGYNIYEEPLRESTPNWDLIPIVWDHPFIEGSPTILSKKDIDNSIGFLINSRFQRSKLYTDLALDTSKIKDFNNIKEMIEKGEPLNVSVSFTTDADSTGSPLDKLTPDHLALLVKKRAACMPEHGCGVNVFSEEGQKLMKEERKTQVIANEYDDDSESMSAVPPGANQGLNPDHVKLAEHIGNVVDRRFSSYRSKMKGLIDQVKNLSDKIGMIEQEKEQFKPVIHDRKDAAEYQTRDPKTYI